jgi:hypothetical protein
MAAAPSRAFTHVLDVSLTRYRNRSRVGHTPTPLRCCSRDDPCMAGADVRYYSTDDGELDVSGVTPIFLIEYEMGRQA